jgi:sugar lactone lactonase YvrE
MDIRSNKHLLTGALVPFGLLLSLLVASIPARAQSAPVVTPPYKISVFAKSPAGTSQPDSMVLWNDSVIVGFQNHVAKDGTDGKSSTIVEFSLTGKVKRTFTVPGHNDGLRVVGDDALWALQNEDANPNLVVVDLRNGKAKQYKFPATPHGGGYDDMVVVGGRVYITASNPNLNSAGVNVFPALVRASLSGDEVVVEPVLNGDAEAVDIPTGKTVKLNLTDPDSLTVDARGNIVLDSQADSELVFIRHPLDEQKVGRLSITSSAATITLDDTAFAPNPKAFLLVSDVNAGVISRIDGGTFGFEPGVAYSASDTLGWVGTLNLDNGVVTPIATGFGSARGLLFIAPNDRDRDGDDK